MTEGSIGIQIGASKEAIEAARDAILAILNAGREEKTIRAALDLFGRVAEVKGATVTDCTITMLPESKPAAKRTTAGKSSAATALESALSEPLGKS